MTTDSLLARVSPLPAVRASAWATAAFAAYEFLALPLMQAQTLATLAIPLVLAYFAFRRVAIGLVALGVLGAWTFVRLLLALTATHSAGLLIVGSLVPVICAGLWIWGAIVTIRSPA